MRLKTGNGRLTHSAIVWSNQCRFPSRVKPMLQLWRYLAWRFALMGYAKDCLAQY